MNFILNFEGTKSMKTIFFLLLSTLLFAHPHIFIDIYPDVVVENGIIKKLHFTWKIDEMSSSMILMDTDSNGNGKIDPNEEKSVEENYFNTMTDYDFYTFIKVANKKIPFPQITHFHPFMENHKMCYGFDLELHTKAKETSLEFGDSDFYVALTLKDKFVKIKGAKAKVTGVDNDFYYGYRLEFK